MPPHERRRPHHDQKLPPLQHTRKDDECDARGIVQPPRLDVPLNIEGQLLAKEEVLGCEARV